jgi:hypothetical protein
LPELAVPVLNTNTPLTPLVPAFAVIIKNVPLEVCDPYPDLKDTCPPDDDDDVPDDNMKSPPVPLFPDPAVTNNDPPRPDLAEPDPIYMLPLFPELEVPVLITIKPLSPEFPAFAVISTNDPLVDIEP